MASLIEQKEAEREHSDGLALAALAEAGDGGARTAEVEDRTGLTTKTTGRALARLVEAGMATRQGERGRWFISPAGQVQAGAGVPGLDVGPALSAAMALLPTEAHKAFVRLLVSAVIARHHLLADYPDGWGGFVTLGPTGTGKTTLAHFVCDVFALDHVRAIRVVQAETPAALLGSRTQEEGGRRTFDPSPLLAEPFLCLDELDKARSAELRAAALKLLQGDAAAELEGHRFPVRPTVMVCLNANPGQLASIVGEAYVRRSVVLDTTPLRPLLDNLASLVRRVRRPGTVPSIDLRRLVPPARTLPEELWQLLHATLAAELTSAGRALVDVEALSRCALGRAPLLGGDLAQAVRATAFDYLTTAATVDHAKEGYAQRLRVELGGELLLPDAGAVDVEGERRRQAATDGRQRDLAAQLAFTAQREAFKAEVERARRPLLRQQDPDVRSVAQALKRVLEELAVRKTPAALDDVRATAAPWVEWAEKWETAHQAEVTRQRQDAERAQRDKALQRDQERQNKAITARGRAQQREFDKRRSQAARARTSELQKLYNRVETRGEDVLAILVEHEVVALRQQDYTYVEQPSALGNWFRRNIAGQPEQGPMQRTGHRSWYEDAQGRRYQRDDLAEFGTANVRAAIEAAASTAGLQLRRPPARKPRPTAAKDDRGHEATNASRRGLDPAKLR